LCEDGHKKKNQPDGDRDSPSYQTWRAKGFTVGFAKKGAARVKHWSILKPEGPKGGKKKKGAPLGKFEKNFRFKLGRNNK